MVFTKSDINLFCFSLFFFHPRLLVDLIRCLGNFPHYKYLVEYHAFGYKKTDLVLPHKKAIKVVSDNLY